MKTFEAAPSTYGSFNGHQQREKIKVTEDFILARIKYLRRLDWYNIISRKDFNRMVDQLSFNSREVLCEANIKQEIFNECPKETRNGISVDNVAKVVAKKILDPLTSKQNKQKLESIFINSSPKPSGLKNTSVLHYWFGGFGIYALSSLIFKKVVSKLSSLLQTGVSSIIQAYFSSGDNHSVGAFCSVYRDPALNISILGLLQNYYLGMDFLQGTYQIPIEGDVQGRRGVGMARKCIDGMDAVMGQVVTFIRNLFVKMFFVKDEVQKTTQFSLGNTLFSLLCILPAAYLIYAVLKSQNSKNGKNDPSQDRFSL